MISTYIVKLHSVTFVCSQIQHNGSSPEPQAWKNINISLFSFYSDDYQYSFIAWLSGSRF